MLKVVGIPSSSYYRARNPGFIIAGEIHKRKNRGYSFNVFGGTTDDEELEKLLIYISNADSQLEEIYYLKFLGSKKLSRYILTYYGIRVNHKKLHRIRKKLNLVGKYKKRDKHPVRRSTSMKVTEKNQLWEADITFVKTREEPAAILTVLDVYDRNVVGTYVGNSCKKENFIELIKLLIENRGRPQFIRTDNGSQFRAINTGIFMNEEEIAHEFGMKRNPNSQAYIESFFSSLKREFAENNEFLNLDDLCKKLNVYLGFYNNLRHHGSLNYYSPTDFSEIRSNYAEVLVKL